MKENIIQVKTFEFALEIIDVYKLLAFEKKEFVMSRQLLRSGTSIGANVEESVGAQSKKDFLNKISISYKEARETRYWIRLLHLSKFLDKKHNVELLDRIDEILRILGSIQKTIKSKI